MRLLNVLYWADKVCEKATIENVEALRWALDALPEGWQDLMLDEIVE